VIKVILRKRYRMLHVPEGCAELQGVSISLTVNLEAGKATVPAGASDPWRPLSGRAGSQAALAKPCLKILDKTGACLSRRESEPFPRPPINNDENN
jgi:hypothetical protein